MFDNSLLSPYLPSFPNWKIFRWRVGVILIKHWRYLPLPNTKTIFIDQWWQVRLSSLSMPSQHDEQWTISIDLPPNFSVSRHFATSFAPFRTNLPAIFYRESINLRNMAGREKNRARAKNSWVRYIWIDWILTRAGAPTIIYFSIPLSRFSRQVGSLFD